MGRPAPRFHDFIGHKRLVDPLKRELAGAIARGVPLPHLLLIGTSGIGKTLLGRALAAERQTKLLYILGTVPQEALIRKLSRLQQCDFLFIDEAHNLKPPEQEVLFQAIDRRKLRMPQKKGTKGTKEKPKTIKIAPFTLILATDRPHFLLNALKKRFPTTLHIPRYCLDEMKEIVATIAAREKVLLSPQATRLLARACHGLPRKAAHFLLRLPNFFRADQGQLGIRDIKSFLRENGIGTNGLGRRERKYLRFLKKSGSSSLETIALVLDTDRDDVAHDIEPLLIRKNLVCITPSGRKLTDKGKELLRSRQRTRKCPKTTKEEEE